MAKKSLQKNATVIVIIGFFIVDLRLFAAAWGFPCVEKENVR